MRHLISRLRAYALPAATEITIPSFLAVQTAFLSVLSVRVHWASIVMAPVAGAVALGSSAVSEGALWALVTVAVSDRSVVSYQRLHRR